jgi:hypothetical protein
VFAGRHWKPTFERVTGVVAATSTKPLRVMTDDGPAIVKYIGNKAGSDALICELIGTELANCIGLTTPDFAVAYMPSLELPTHLFLRVESGPAFFSKWEDATSLSPRSTLLGNLRKPDDIAKLVAFDTWLRNKDRFSDPANQDFGSKNFDNLLLRPDKRKVQLLVIDHSHAIAETTLEDELGQGWVDEQKVYGMFPEFVQYVTRRGIQGALAEINKIDVERIERICQEVPRDWGMTHALAQRLSNCIVERARKLGSWLPALLFDQYEMNLEGREG